jgi:hypothetical protein
MASPRDWLGLPKANAGIFLSQARVLDTAGVAVRAALPIPEDDVFDGGSEWVFLNPAEQLEENWIIP